MSASSFGTTIHGLLERHFPFSKYERGVDRVRTDPFLIYLAIGLIQAQMNSLSSQLLSDYSWWSVILVVLIVSILGTTTLTIREQEEELGKQLREVGEQVSSVQSTIGNLSEMVQDIRNRQDHQLDGLELAATELATQGEQFQEKVQKEFKATKKEIDKIQDALVVAATMMTNLSKMQLLQASETCKLQCMVDASNTVVGVDNFEMKPSKKTIGTIVCGNDNIGNNSDDYHQGVLSIRLFNKRGRSWLCEIPVRTDKTFCEF